MVGETWHHDCILDGDHKGPWCATTLNYEHDQKWGICLKAGMYGLVNSNSKERVPFIQGKGGEEVAGDDLKVSATDAFLDEECAFAEG